MLLTDSIQRPDFGSATEKPAMAKNSGPMPSAYVKRSEPPTATERVVATYASTEASTGPVHGAAMMPPTSPMAKAPPKPLPPTDDNRVCSEVGRLISNAPNIDAAITTNKAAMGT